MVAFGRVLFTLCLIAGLVISETAGADFPMDLVPAAPAGGDSVTLRLQPNTGPLGRQAQFVTSPDYPQITRIGNAFAIRALICRFPETNSGPMTRDLVLGSLPAGTYSVELYVTDICTSIGPPPATIWSGVFLVRGEQIEIPFLGALGLGVLGLGLAAVARSVLGRRVAP